MAKPGLAFSLSGDREIERTLARIPIELREKAIPQALRFAGRGVVAAAKKNLRNINFDDSTGALEASMGLVTRGRRGRPKYVVIGARRGPSFKRIDSRGKARVPANYSHLVENGHFASDGKFVNGTPFLAPALAGSRGLVRARFIVSLRSFHAQRFGAGRIKTKERNALINELTQ